MGTLRPLHCSLGVLLLAALTGGCADTAYLWQSASGHLRILQAARPVDVWLHDDSTPPELKHRLQTAQAMRRFAVDVLQLPDNASYQRFAQIPRRAVVWNVVAAPVDTLKVKTWCFPLVGCVGYRGYYNEADAQTMADSLRAQGLEASVYGVPAYSTLGWTNWLGGDPLLSTFIHYPQGELARLIFHEMAHQVVYVQDDTAFNESFATAVERLGSTQWLSQAEHADAAAPYARFYAQRQAFRALTTHTRQALRATYALYPADGVQPRSDAQTLALQTAKAAVYADFRQAYRVLQSEWGGDTGYDSWVANANNASFGALAAYDDWVGAFETLFHQQAGNWPAFYGAARELGALGREARTARLRQLQQLQNPLQSGRANAASLMPPIVATQ